MFTLVVGYPNGGIVAIPFESFDLAEKAMQSLGLKYTVTLIRTR